MSREIGSHTVTLSHRYVHSGTYLGKPSIIPIVDLIIWAYYFPLFTASTQFPRLMFIVTATCLILVNELRPYILITSSHINKQEINILVACHVRLLQIRFHAPREANCRTTNLHTNSDPILGSSIFRVDEWFPCYFCLSILCLANEDDYAFNVVRVSWQLWHAQA